MDEEQLRRERARAMAARCQGEHVVGDLICYCILKMGHGGSHRDYRGREFAEPFSWIGRWARSQRKASRRTTAP